MVYAGVMVAIVEGSTILLTLREDFEVWCLPGGEIDADESIADAARREVREETGLEVELTRLVGIYSQLGWNGGHDILFEARIISGSLRLDPHEVLEARFFPFDALPELMIAGQRDALQDVISGVSGVVKTQFISAAPDLPRARADLYALRDQSSLSRQEFYRTHFPDLKSEQVKIEIAGVHEQNK